MKAAKDMRVATLSGAVSASGLWLIDITRLTRLSGYEFAGVSDAEAATRVLEVTESALLSMEAKLLLIHILLGALLGGAAGAFFRGRFTSVRLAAVSSLFTVAIALSSLFGMVARYPQLFADRWWLSGGARASLQRVLTHGVGANVLDAISVALLVGAVAVPSFRVLRYRRTLSKKLAVATGIFAAIVTVRSARSDLGNGSKGVLIIATDSLRTESIEDPDVMPFTASRVEDGALYRYAVTPIARTYPAWVSTLTGTEPRVHDVRHMFPMPISRRDVGPTLFTELRDRGYFTFATSDFAGDVFPGFEGGFEILDTPHLNVDTLAQSAVLSRHTWSLPLLRFRWFRDLFPYWRNLPSLANPEWVVDEALSHLNDASDRPFAGLVFFSTAHFPYVGPYPYYLRESGDYHGRYLYHVPPVQPEEAPDEDDVRQIRARYDGALAAIDRATERLLRHVGNDTLVVITGDHGEELYEEDGIAGHGDTLRHMRSQAVPILLLGPGVPKGLRSSNQVRHYDLPATVLDVLGGSTTFGHGTSLLEERSERPVCVETGIWFWPSRPLGLRGSRLDYPSISELLELEPSTREMILKPEMESLVESAKERGVILGNRLYREQPTPSGLERETLVLPGLKAAHENVNLPQLFEERCVDGDASLSRLYGAIVFERTPR